MVENLKMPLTPVETHRPRPVRHHRARRQPARDRATTRCRTVTASTSSSITTRCAPGSARAAWCDIRPDLGATSTIVFEYLRQRAVPIDAPLATAFFFALRTETRDLGRESTEAERQRLPRRWSRWSTTTCSTA